MDGRFYTSKAKFRGLRIDALDRALARREICNCDRSWQGVRCVFGCNAAVVGIYWIPRGCVCHRDQTQALCAQHAVSAEPLGEMRLIAGHGPVLEE